MVLDAPDRDFEALQHINSAPDRPRGTFAVHMEGGRWVVTVFGAGGDHQPTDERGWREFAENLGNADLDALLESATPVPGLGIYGFKRTENRRNDYAAMRRWPRRLVAIGDSLAAFDPVFGQGMTVSVLHAQALGEALARTDDLDAVARRAQRRVAAIVADVGQGGPGGALLPRAWRDAAVAAPGPVVQAVAHPAGRRRPRSVPRVHQRLSHGQVADRARQPADAGQGVVQGPANRPDQARRRSGRRAVKGDEATGPSTKERRSDMSETQQIISLVRSGWLAPLSRPSLPSSSSGYG
jgi:2-polyprenyl-6-methoxyphenol hydroxylase-like FAD-dependent oxidoreductase